MRAFARDVDFTAFMADHAELIDTTEARLRRLIASHVDAAWLAEFWGGSPGARFVIVPGLLNGRASYGVEFSALDGTREIYAITGVNDVDAAGLPRFLLAFARVAEKMRAQAYGTWQSMLYETLVRAAVVRYVAAHDGEADAAAELREQVESGFVWLPELDALLQRYERERARYPSMRAFMTEIVAFLRAQSRE